METYEVTKYGIRRIGQQVRYVGITLQNLDLRLYQHKALSKSGNDDRKFYRWLRENEDVEIVSLGTLVGDVETVRLAESGLIAHYMNLLGDDSLNTFSASAWHPIPPKDESTRERYSEAKRGEKNYWYGKKGSEHTNFGRKLSDEHRQKLSDAKTGERHPNFGKSLKDDTKSRISESLKERNASPEGKAKRREAGLKASHTRHHLNKGIKKIGCAYCAD